MALMRRGVTDLNTEDPALIEAGADATCRSSTSACA